MIAEKLNEGQVLELMKNSLYYYAKNAKPRGQNAHYLNCQDVLRNPLSKKKLPEAADKLKADKSYKYGDTMLTFYRKAEV